MENQQRDDLIHANWLENPVTRTQLKKLREYHQSILLKAQRYSNGASQNDKDIALNFLKKAATINEIIEYVTTNKYPENT